MSISNGSPWQQPNYNYGDGIIGLHEEINHFYKYILPTPCEHAVRIEAIRRVENLIKDLWPQAVVEIFGSFRTGLFLPNSDIDLVVIGLWEHLPLRTLEKALVARGIAGTVNVLDKATVPIIKFTERETNIKFDLSFNIPYGVQSAELIKTFKREYPALGQLVLVLKQFMMQRDLNNVFTGGISSFSLIIMCISFLQLHPRHVFDSNANIGVLLLEFFELYGQSFNFAQVGICIRNGGSYIETKHMTFDSKPALYIEDPFQPGNNIGRGSYSITEIKQAFRYAYCVLSQAINPLNISSSRQRNISILGRIIHISSEASEQRALLHKKYSDLLELTSNSPSILPSTSREQPSSSTIMAAIRCNAESPLNDKENECAEEILVEDDSTDIYED